MDVLIVDDDELNGRALSRVLKSRHAVRVATSAAKALAAVRAHTPDVVLCDFDLGDHTSAVFLRTVAREHPGCRLVLYSASKPELWQDLLTDHVIDEVLIKPITTDALLASLVRRSGG
jgi:DNA-binding NtrC family response regulator